MKHPTVLAFLLFVLAFGLYLHGAYPTVSVGDSGEFITAAHTLGIPHAPGYPAYTLPAKAFESLLPWGNPGYRINVFSALCGTLTVTFLYVLALRLGMSWEVGFGAALVFMLSRAQWVNAQASEVFALHALFCVAFLGAVFSRQWLLAAFVAGVGLGNHQTLLFLLPAVAVAYAADHPKISWPAFISCFVLGLSVHVFLCVRAGQMPVLNAGDPRTFERLWRVLTRADYGSLTLALGETPSRSWGSTWQHLERFTRGLAGQVSWAGVAAGVIGIVVGIHRRFTPMIALAAVFLLIGPFFFIVGNLPFDGQSLGLLERFYIVPTLCWSLLIAYGIQVLAERRRWIAPSIFFLPLLLVGRSGLAFPFRQDVRAYAYGQNNLRTLPHGALFLMDGGDDTFYTLAYLTRVEGQRPDLSLYDRGGVVFPGFYGNDFRALTAAEKELRRTQVERAAIASGRTLYYSTMNEQILPGSSLSQEGMLYRQGSGRAHDLWEVYDLRGVAPWNAPTRFLSQDYRLRALVPFYAYQRSVQAARENDSALALAFASTAQTLGSDVVWLIPNLLHNAYLWGHQYFEAGRLDPAAQVFREIIRWDPQAAVAWTDLGAIEERRQRLDAAVAAYQKAIAIDPTSEMTHYNLAVAYWKRSDWPNVVSELTRVLAINPANTAARNYLTQARAHLEPSHP